MLHKESQNSLDNLVRILSHYKNIFGNAHICMEEQTILAQTGVFQRKLLQTYPYDSSICDGSVIIQYFSKWKH